MILIWAWKKLERGGGLKVDEKRKKEIKKLRDKIANLIYMHRNELSDENYPDNVVILETIGEDIKALLIKNEYNR